MEKHPLCPKMMKNTLKVIVDAKKEAKRDANIGFFCSVYYII